VTHNSGWHWFIFTADLNSFQLLQTPYESWAWVSPIVIAPALLRLDPLWDPLRSEPAFQKLCQEKP